MKIAFYKGRKRIFNRLVSFWTRGPYSHTELVFSNGESASSSFLDGGVRFKFIEFNGDLWDIIELPERLFNEKCAKDFFSSQLGKKFDIVGLIGFVLGPIQQHKSKYFCSEICLSALGIKESWRYHPNLAYSLITEIILNEGQSKNNE